MIDLLRVGDNPPTLFYYWGGDCLIDLKILGQKCRSLRKSLNVRQYEVANETGYTVKSISAFENGRVNNAIILLWYINHGLEGGLINGKSETCFKR